MAKITAKVQIMGNVGDDEGYQYATFTASGTYANNDTLEFPNCTNVFICGISTNKGRTPKFDNKVINRTNKTTTFTFTGNRGSDDTAISGLARVIQRS